MQKPVGEAGEGDWSLEDGLSWTLHLNLASWPLPLDCADCRPAGHPGVLGPSECISEPRVAKNAELWPTLRSFSRQIVERASRFHA